MSPTSHAKEAHMEGKPKEPDVSWNIDGRPINWNGRDWPLYRRQRLLYLTCLDVKENEKPLDAICEGTEVEQDNWSDEQKTRFRRKNTILAKIISSLLSCTLARQVMNFNTGRDMWEYLSKRYEGRENATTKLYTQRTLRQKLENATCRGGADVETHLSYLLSLRERLAALDVNLSDDWMVDIMVRSMSQFEFYPQLKMLVLPGGSQLTTPMEARAMTLTLEKNSALERSQKRPTAVSISSSGEQASASSFSTSTAGKKRSQSDSRTDQLQHASKKQKTVSEKSLQRQKDMAAGACFLCHNTEHRKFECTNQDTDEIKTESASSTGNELHSKFTNAADEINIAPKYEKPLRIPTVRDEDEYVNGHNIHEEVERDGWIPGPGEDEYRGDSLFVESREVMPYSVTSWCFDCASNRHLVGDKSYFIEYTELDESNKQPIRRCHGWTQADGIGKAEIWFEIQGRLVSLQLEGVYYAEKHENLISQSNLEDQGFKVHYDSDRHVFSATKDGITSLEVKRNRIGMYFITAA